jgi:hypothetical protein
MRVTDELLYQHIAEARSIVLSTFPSDENLPEYKTSKRYHRIINRLLKQQKRSPQLNKTILYFKRSLVIALAAIIITFSGCMAFEEFREKVVEVVVSVFHELTDYRFYVDSFASSDEILEKLPKITCEYIPKGMERLEDRKSDYTSCLYYENEEGNYVEIIQRLITPNDKHNTILDTEDATTYTTYINGKEATVNIKGTTITLIWNNSNVSYVITSDISLEETIKIAENIKEIRV